MPNLETTYLGLKLKNPLVAASSGLTGSPDKIKELENAGIAAVVIKSIFEEQIIGETGDLMFQSGEQGGYPEAYDYLQNYVRQNSISKHTGLISRIKQNSSIPVIASVNCISSSEWISFARELEEAGADAIELNIFYLPTERNQSPAEVEKVYTDILQEVRRLVKIPVSVKIGRHFSNIIGMAEKLKAGGASGLVLFNRFYEPDIDLEKLEMKSTEVFSSPSENAHLIRWIGLITSKVTNLELAATTGIHSGDAVIKQLLAGARVVQLCSVLYLQGPEVIPQMLGELVDFMKKWNFKTIDDFRGRLSAKNIPDPMKYARSQFMKYYSDHK